jgi:hypothetical protein
MLHKETSGDAKNDADGDIGKEAERCLYGRQILDDLVTEYCQLIGTRMRDGDSQQAIVDVHALQNTPLQQHYNVYCEKRHVLPKAVRYEWFVSALFLPMHPEEKHGKEQGGNAHHREVAGLEDIFQPLCHNSVTLLANCNTRQGIMRAHAKQYEDKPIARHDIPTPIQSISLRTLPHARHPMLPAPAGITQQFTKARNTVPPPHIQNPSLHPMIVSCMRPPNTSPSEKPIG